MITMNDINYSTPDIGEDVLVKFADNNSTIPFAICHACEDYDGKMYFTNGIDYEMEEIVAWIYIDDLNMCIDY